MSKQEAVEKKQRKAEMLKAKRRFESQDLNFKNYQKLKDKLEADNKGKSFLPVTVNLGKISAGKYDNSIAEKIYFTGNEENLYDLKETINEYLPEKNESVIDDGYLKIIGRKKVEISDMSLTTAPCSSSSRRSSRPSFSRFLSKPRCPNLAPASSDESSH